MTKIDVTIDMVSLIVDDSSDTSLLSLSEKNPKYTPTDSKRAKLIKDYALHWIMYYAE